MRAEPWWTLTGSPLGNSPRNSPRLLRHAGRLRLRRLRRPHPLLQTRPRLRLRRHPPSRTPPAAVLRPRISPPLLQPRPRLRPNPRLLKGRLVARPAMEEGSPVVGASACRAPEGDGCLRRLRRLRRLRLRRLQPRPRLRRKHRLEIGVAPQRLRRLQPRPRLRPRLRRPAAFLFPVDPSDGS